ncbi:hypothetical protein [Mesorhizobium sophorae]|uniref:hypothetical protein n=1 Tax=Mesorhizobium sophorae TaxID=1300294 RepID=UPI000BA4D200|nr:hypothetical protein [Mesorhizobium sophorae]
MLKLSRAELYELVWSKPMTEIARDHGVRDQHIARACDHHDIARPRAGYWQKLDHGKVVERVALGNDTFSADDIVTIDLAGWRTHQTMRGKNSETARRRSAV